MDYNTVKQLIGKYQKNALSESERKVLLELTEKQNDPTLVQTLELMLAEEQAEDAQVDQKRLRRTLQTVLDSDKPSRAKRRFPIQWLGYAAAVLLIAGMGIFIWKHIDLASMSGDPGRVYTQDIGPGGERATLTLSDGSTIRLDATGDGILATQQGSQLRKNSGKLIYTPSGKGSELPVYNTLRTPKGGIYQLYLPDGTRVLLNAASSIRYPVMFSADQRKVQVSGEVYFEVASMPDKPFIVQIDEHNTIQVLGTHFNVKAYPGEPAMTTTLLEGKINLRSYGKSKLLRPGQQARAAGKTLSVRDIGAGGVASVMAWKDGRFNFQDADLQEIMRQLARWYDIEVVYQGEIPQLEFIGEIQRTLPLSEVLKGLEMSGVHFRMEKDRRLVVLP